MKINAKDLHYRKLNEMIRMLLKKGLSVKVNNVCGHRYIGCGLQGDGGIEITGTPGNDLAAFMDGPTIKVHGNVQDGVGNTMNKGTVVVYGNAGDLMGYAMRGGKIFIRGGAGYRTGIHMKSYKDCIPVIIVGENTQDYGAEYMAGGIFITLGLSRKDKKIPGNFIGTGMHGGILYLRGTVEDHQLGKEVGRAPITPEDWKTLKSILNEFSGYFKVNTKTFTPKDFVKLVPLNSRPYGKLYAY
ncbi:MAG: hypothetical protein ABIA63_10700 [bacterium]